MNTAALLILENLVLLDGKTAREVIMSWHASLENQRGWRAELRRAGDLQTLLMCPGFHQLAQPFKKWLEENEWGWQALAMAAGAASFVKEDNPRYSFAAQLGRNKAGGSDPILSPLRFSRLNQAYTHHELYRRIIQAIRQLDGKVNLLSMIDGIFLWCREYDDLHNQKLSERSPFERPALRWASEYFQATAMTEE